MSSTQITLHNTSSSPALARSVQEKCERLSRIHPDVRLCRVSVNGPEPGTAGAEFRVTLRVLVPEGEIAPETQCHAQVAVAVERAFAAARRALEEAMHGSRPARARNRTPMEARK